MSLVVRLARAKTGKDVVVAFWLSWMARLVFGKNLKIKQFERTFITWS